MESSIIKYTLKRDGRIVSFDGGRILNAILMAMSNTPEGRDEALAEGITSAVVASLESYCGNSRTDSVSVDLIHDFVEKALMSSSRQDAA